MPRHIYGDQKTVSEDPGIAFHHVGSEGQFRLLGLVAATFLY